MGNDISPGTNTDLCSSLEYMVEFTPHIHCSEKSRTIPCDCIYVYDRKWYENRDALVDFMKRSGPVTRPTLTH